jgi:glycosyltransferase involved in cell wall biosynthesis
LLLLSIGDGDNRRNVLRRSRLMKLFVSIPALNEQVTIGQVVRGVPRDIPGVDEVEILVIDDGSTDNTALEARNAGATVVSHPTNRGVGAAFHTALTYVIENRGDFLLTIDADGQFNPADIPTLAAPVVGGMADFATASRFKDESLIPEMPGAKLWGNRMMSRLVSRLTGGKYFDVSCGMRCYNRKSMLNLNLMGAFTYTQEVFLNLAFKRLRIVEVPINVRGQREFGKSRVASNLFKYALNTSRIIFRAYRDYKPMRFFGSIALWLGVPAVLLELFLGIHYLRTGQFSPHKWAGFTGGAMSILSLISLAIGLIGDMMNRQRVYLEELLYRQRDGAWRDAAADAAPARAEETVRAAAHREESSIAV